MEEVNKAEVNQPTEKDGKSKREKNLIPMRTYDGMSEDEKKRQFEIRSKGGKARQEQIAKRKSMREDLEQLLNCKVSKDQAEILLGDDAEMLGNDFSVQRVMLVRAIQEATQEGSAKLLEFIRNTVGDAPKTEISLDADIITESDKRLLDSFEVDSLVNMPKKKSV